MSNPEIKCHANALCTKIVRSHLDSDYYAVLASRDNERPGFSVLLDLGVNPAWIPPNTSPEDHAAIVAMDYYLHEMGEHIQIGDMSLNQHTRKGAANFMRILRLFVAHTEARTAEMLTTNTEYFIDDNER